MTRASISAQPGHTTIARSDQKYKFSKKLHNESSWWHWRGPECVRSEGHCLQLTPQLLSYTTTRHHVECCSEPHRTCDHVNHVNHATHVQVDWYKQRTWSWRNHVSLVSMYNESCDLVTSVNLVTPESRYHMIRHCQEPERTVTPSL